MLKQHLTELAQHTKMMGEQGACQRCSAFKEQIEALQAQVGTLQEQRTTLKENHGLREQQWHDTAKREATEDYMSQLKGPLGEALRAEVRAEMRQGCSGELSQMKEELEQELEEAVWQVNPT